MIIADTQNAAKAAFCELKVCKVHKVCKVKAAVEPPPEKYMSLQENENLARERQREEVVARLGRRMMAYLDQVGGSEFRNWKEKCVREIRKNNINPDPDPYSYCLFNMLVGGSGGSEMPYFDFSGDFSIQKIIEELPLYDEKEKTKT